MDQNGDHPSAPGTSDRDKIIDALLALLAERRIERISLSDVARRAQVSLAQCRTQFDSLLSVLAAFTKRIDEQVLREPEDDSADESPRERLFDILMRRFEALTPHRPAIRSLARSASCNPPLALALNGLALRSQQWMLEAAGISTSGLRGVVRIAFA